MEFVGNHVASTGRMPSDSMMEARGRQILNTETTAAEDPALLNQFKDMMSQRLPQAGPAEDGANTASAIPDNINIHISDEDINNILQDMNFEFDPQDFGGVSLLGMEGVEEGGGVRISMDGVNNN